MNNDIDREMIVGARLKNYRENLKMSRVAFAISAGIGTERMASYENGRVPLRYGVFAALARRYCIHPQWLISGDCNPGLSGRYDDSRMGKLDPRAPFTKIWDEVLSKVNPAEYTDIADALQVQAVSVGELVAAINAHPQGHQEAEALLSFLSIVTQQLRETVKAHVKSIDYVTLQRNSIEVDSLYGSLLGRLRKQCEARGKKAALADFLSVPPPRVSEWLSGKVEPGAENTLRMLQWVAMEEGKQGGPDSALTPSRPETQARKSRNENRSGPKGRT